MRKNILIVAITVIISACISMGLEVLVYNYETLESKAERYIDRTEFNVEDRGADESLVISLEKPVYVQKLIIAGNISRNQAYTIQINYLNKFGKEATRTFEDTMCFAFTKHYTNINEKVTSVNIIIPKSSNNFDISFEGMIISSKFEINKWRVLFWTLVLSCIFIVYKFRPFFKIKAEFFFLYVGLISGISIIILTGTNLASWDETTHFSNIYQFGVSDEVEWSQTSYMLSSNVYLPWNTIEEKNQAIAFYNEHSQIDGTLNDEIGNGFVQYGKRPYFFQALVFHASKAMGIGFNRCFMLGKLANLIMYLALMTIAIKIAKRGKWIITCVGLLPTPIFIASSYSYDAVVIACLTLAFVMWMNEMIENDEKIKKRSFIIMLLLFVFGSFAKAVYIPLVLFMCMFKRSKYKDKLQQKILCIGVIMVFIVMMASFVLPAAGNVVANNVEYTGDLRGGETSSVLQIKSIFNHSLEYTKLLVSSIVSIDNFRNFGTSTLDDYLALDLGTLNMGKYGTMPDKFTYILLPYLGFIMVFFRQNEKEFAKRIKVGIGMIIFGIICLIWTAMYLSFTSVGLTEISGVQARYYLPLMIPTLFIIPIKHIKLNISNGCGIGIAMTGAGFFLFYCIYFLILKATCF